MWRSNTKDTGPTVFARVLSTFDLRCEEDTDTVMMHKLNSWNCKKVVSRLQRILGETTDERISTDLDCIKNRLWCVNSIGQKRFSTWEPLLTYTIYTCNVHMYFSGSWFVSFTNNTKTTFKQIYRRTIKSIHSVSPRLWLSIHLTISMSLSYKSTISPSVVSKSSSVTSVTWQISLVWRTLIIFLVLLCCRLLVIKDVILSVSGASVAPGTSLITLSLLSLSFQVFLKGFSYFFFSSVGGRTAIVNKSEAPPPGGAPPQLRVGLGTEVYNWCINWMTWSL